MESNRKALPSISCPVNCYRNPSPLVLPVIPPLRSGFQRNPEESGASSNLNREQPHSDEDKTIIWFQINICDIFCHLHVINVTNGQFIICDFMTG